MIYTANRQTGLQVSARHAIPALLLRRNSDQADTPQTAEIELPEALTAHSPKILCANCKEIITEPIFGIEMQGWHRHKFVNPHGYQFLIACFRDARGCEVSGKCTGDYSWFSGYCWRYAVCKYCGEHVGWHYRGTGDSFFGLICMRLIFPEPRN